MVIGRVTGHGPIEEAARNAVRHTENMDQIGEMIRGQEGFVFGREIRQTATDLSRLQEALNGSGSVEETARAVAAHAGNIQEIGESIRGQAGFDFGEAIRAAAKDLVELYRVVY